MRSGRYHWLSFWLPLWSYFCSLQQRQVFLRMAFYLSRYFFFRLFSNFFFTIFKRKKKVLPLVKSTDWRESNASKAVVGALSSIFSVAITSGSSRYSICIFPDLTMAKKLSAQMIFQAIIILVFAAFFGGHGIACRCFRRFGLSAPDPIRYSAALVNFLTIAYITMVFLQSLFRFDWGCFCRCCLLFK